MRLTGYVLLGLTTLLFARAPRAAPTGGTVSGTVRFLRDGKSVEIPDGFVYLVPTPTPRGRVLNTRTETIVQKDRKFRPNRVVIPVGSTVAFPNKEPPSTKNNDHNVFSPSTTSPSIPLFDLDRYGSGKSKSQMFRDEGEYDIYCDIHVQMNAKVKVVDSDRIVPVMMEKGAKMGTYSLRDVPAGKYKLYAWAPDSVEVFERITVVADQATQVPQLNVQLGQPKPHVRKDGTPYTLDYNK